VIENGPPPGSAPFGTDREALDLLERFREGSLPKAAFTHRAHLMVGLWFLDHHDEANARKLVPEAIKRFNDRVGTVPKPRGGYHETITQFYLSMIARFRRRWRGGTSFAARANALYQELEDRSLPLRHYSETLLWSDEARARWVAPDLAAIDE
jgi:hypothetical protein